MAWTELSFSFVCEYPLTQQPICSLYVPSPPAKPDRTSHQGPELQLHFHQANVPSLSSSTHKGYTVLYLKSSHYVLLNCRCTVSHSLLLLICLILWLRYGCHFYFTVYCLNNSQEQFTPCISSFYPDPSDSIHTSLLSTSRRGEKTTLVGQSSPFCYEATHNRGLCWIPLEKVVHELIYPCLYSLSLLMPFLELEQTACACRTHKTDV